MYAQLLIAASLIIASYYDVKERMVSDLVWLPAVAGAVVVFVLLPSEWLQLAIRLALVGGVSFAFTWYGGIGQADAIALVLVSTDPFPLTPIPMLLVAGVAALAHISILYMRGMVGKPRVIPLEQFRREARWIPRALIRGGVRTEVDGDVNVSREDVEREEAEKATATATTMVEVQYGVPTVAYIGIGYVVYLAYLAVFQPGVLLALA